MKKILAIILTMVMACMILAGCGAKKYEIALITIKGNIDDKSFNQGAWEGVKQFTKDNKYTSKYFKPEIPDDAGYLAMIDNAVTAGAKVIVTPGYYFEVPVYEAQTKYRPRLATTPSPRWGWTAPTLSPISDPLSKAFILCDLRNDREMT